MSLFDVSFTTKKLVKKLDAKGNVIEETPLKAPITHTALPYATAMSYAIADDFEIRPHVPSEKRQFASKGPGRVDAIGNGTKMRSGRRSEIDSAPSTPPVARPDTSAAARSGDLSAAING